MGYVRCGAPLNNPDTPLIVDTWVIHNSFILSRATTKKGSVMTRQSGYLVRDCPGRVIIQGYPIKKIKTI